MINENGEYKIGLNAIVKMDVPTIYSPILIMQKNCNKFLPNISNDNNQWTLELKKFNAKRNDIFDLVLV